MIWKLLPLALTAAVPMALQASDMTLYGVGHLALSSYEIGPGATDADGFAQSDYWDLSTQASRIGVKGSEDLGDGLKSIYLMEFMVPLTDVNNDINDGDPGSIGMLKSYVGLTGGWGTFYMGRQDTPYMITTDAMDLFADTIADYSGNPAEGSEAGTTVGGLGFYDVTVDSGLFYVSPEMNGFTFSAALVPPGNSTEAGADNNAANGLAEVISLGAIYSNGPFYGAVGYESWSDEVRSPAADDALELMRLGLGYTANNVQVGFIYEHQNEEAAASDVDIWQINGAYSFGNNVLKVSYGEGDSEVAGADRQQWTLGMDHNFSTRTKVYALYTDHDNETAANDWSGFSFGMVHNF
ncbi:MAG: porin [Gammaproteobacteria bacterium]|nr:porin [Gammaproteobacteria bacterium]MBU1656406.1 porin [Gammaproteobacteria bacterium]MBU1960954.1 porin [Gammaproteobacteria bacterium]